MMSLALSNSICSVCIRFLNFGTMGILYHNSLLWEAVLCTMWFLAASLASTYSMTVPTPPPNTYTNHDSQKDSGQS